VGRQLFTLHRAALLFAWGFFLSWATLCPCTAQICSCPSRDLAWTYNIRGISECPPPDSVLEFTCKTRTTKVFPISLVLPGLVFGGSEEVFTHELVVRGACAVGVVIGWSLAV
jgi:hypothetical protein